MQIPIIPCICFSSNGWPSPLFGSGNVMCPRVLDFFFWCSFRGSSAPAAGSVVHSSTYPFVCANNTKTRRWGRGHGRMSRQLEGSVDACLKKMAYSVWSVSAHAGATKKKTGAVSTELRVHQQDDISLAPSLCSRMPKLHRVAQDGQQSLRNTETTVRSCCASRKLEY